MNPKVDGSPLTYRKVLKGTLPKFGAINGNPHQNLVALCYRGVMLTYPAASPSDSPWTQSNHYRRQYAT